MDTIISLLFYALTGLLLGLIVYSVFQNMSFRNKKKALLKLELEQEDILDNFDEESNEKKKTIFNPITQLKEKIEKMYYFSPKNRSGQLFVFILGVEAIAFVFMMVMQKYFVAFLFVVIIHLVSLKLIQIKTNYLKDYIQTDLPLAIKHVVKVLTKTSDLKTVFLDASKGMKEPLRSHFVEMSRLMISGSHEKALMKFANDSDSIWAYSFAFIMASYKDSSKKSEIIRNLTLLGSMMEAENLNAERSLTERKAIIVLNNILAILAMITFILNILKNDYALTFFFETPGGVMALIGGFTFLGLTLVVNFIVGKKRY